MGFDSFFINDMGALILFWFCLFVCFSIKKAGFLWSVWKIASFSNTSILRLANRLSSVGHTCHFRG